MADEGRGGKDWAEDELDAIVADYFDMLDAEVAGRPYVKSRHNTALMERIGRSHASVEFKHQNISAVLEEMGMPWIVGYKPRKNYQQAIFGAIDRYLSRRPAALEFVPSEKAATSRTRDVFVDPPQLSSAEVLPDGLRRLVRKFDPVERDHRNRALGRAGEVFVLDIERKRLANGDGEDLARKVRWVADEDGDGAGYDVLSFEPSGGRERLIEVKTTNGAARTPFFLSRNEREMSIERPADWIIYRVHLFATDARIFTVAPPIEKAVNLRSEIWRASFDC
jgi:hypothetical protein